MHVRSEARRDVLARAMRAAEWRMPLDASVRAEIEESAQAIEVEQAQLEPDLKPAAARARLCLRAHDASLGSSWADADVALVELAQQDASCSELPALRRLRDSYSAAADVRDRLRRAVDSGEMRGADKALADLDLIPLAVPNATHNHAHGRTQACGTCTHAHVACYTAGSYWYCRVGRTRQQGSASHQR